MDPIANIQEQRELANMLLSGEAHDFVDTAVRLAELVLALDEWRRKGGYDPYEV